MKTIISFSIDTERDADLFDWIKSIPDGQRSSLIRDALRNHIDPQAGSDVTLRDIMQEIQDLKRHGIAVQGDTYKTGHYDEEPPDIANALNNLGL